MRTLGSDEGICSRMAGAKCSFCLGAPDLLRQPKQKSNRNSQVTLQVRRRAVVGTSGNFPVQSETKLVGHPRGKKGGSEKINSDLWL